ncbi:MAG TPA: hypothetical protein VIE86_04165 [Nitrososphaera sp.]|jgi:hypothetical protein
MSSGSRYSVAALLTATIVAGLLQPAYSQESGASMTKPLDGGSLDIMLEPISSQSNNVTFRVAFLNPNSTVVHEHQDYDFIIKQGETEIFSAAKKLNQPLIHNVNGTIKIPYNFSQNGDYTVEVRVLGLGFPPIPINPETATFPVQVTPEFPVGMIGVVAALVGAAIVATRKFKLF